MREIINMFADRMQHKIDKNKHKSCAIMNKEGRGREWGHCSIEWLLFRLRQEVMELEDACIENHMDPEKVKDECADVGNFAMMIFSNIDTAK